MSRRLAVVVLLSLPIVPPSAGLAQPAASDGWQHTLALYGLATAIGDLAFGEVEAPIEVDASQMFDSLEMAAMARYRGQAERWAVVIDGSFAGLGGTREGALTRQDLDIDMFIVQADAAYRVSEFAEVLPGVRYVRFESRLDTTTVLGGGRRRENDATLPKNSSGGLFCVIKPTFLLERNPMLNSRKFKALLLDTIFSLILYGTSNFVSPENARHLITVIGMIQPVVVAYVLGVAIEDAAAKRAGAEPYSPVEDVRSDPVL